MWWCPPSSPLFCSGLSLAILVFCSPIWALEPICPVLWGAWHGHSHTHEAQTLPFKQLFKDDVAQTCSPCAQVASPALTHNPEDTLPHAGGMPLYCWPWGIIFWKQSLNLICKQLIIALVGKHCCHCLSNKCRRQVLRRAPHPCHFRFMSGCLSSS